MTKWGRKKNGQPYPKNGKKKSGISEKILTNEQKLSNYRILQASRRMTGKNPVLPAVYDKEKKTLKTMEMEYPEEVLDPITGEPIVKDRPTLEELAIRGSKDKYGKIIRASGLPPMMDEKKRQEILNRAKIQKEVLRLYVNDVDGGTGLDRFGRPIRGDQKLEERLAGYFFMDRSKKKLDEGVDPDTGEPTVSIKKFNWRSLGSSKTRDESMDLFNVLKEEETDYGDGKYKTRAKGIPYYFQTLGGMRAGTNALRVYGFKNQLEAEQAGLAYVNERSKKGVDRWKEILMKPYNKALLQMLLAEKKFRTRESRQKPMEEMTVNDLSPEVAFFTGDIMTNRQRTNRKYNRKRLLKEGDDYKKKMAQLEEELEKINEEKIEKENELLQTKIKSEKAETRDVGKGGKLQQRREATKENLVRMVGGQIYRQARKTKGEPIKISDKTKESIARGVGEAEDEATKEDAE